MISSLRLFVLPGILAMALTLTACGAGSSTPIDDTTSLPTPSAGTTGTGTASDGGNTSDPGSTSTGGNGSTTDSNTTVGDSNTVAGNGNTTVGDSNTVAGNGNTTDSNTTVGDSNTVAGNGNTAVGDSNTTAGNANAVACTVDPIISTSDEVFVTKLSVVEDANRTVWTGNTANTQDGAWSMGRILHNVAGSQDANAFTSNWLNLWATAQKVGGQTVQARTQINAKVLNIWPKQANGQLDLTRPPFRLLAITNRIDLRQPAAGSAGELRFIYALVDSQGNPQPFTVIFEFNMPTTATRNTLAWATDWHDLAALSQNTTAYNTALQAITDLVTGPNTQASHPTGSALFRIRTNENALNAVWELRQFEVQTTGALAEVGVTDTPALSLNQTKTFADFVNQNTNAILASNLTVPVTFENTNFLAGSIFTQAISGGPTTPNFRPANNDPNAIASNIAEWMSTEIVNNDARAIVSLNTCNGCHGGETATPFLHVTTRRAGQESTLSGFLTGETILDPQNPNIQRSYSDLQRRANEMVQVLCHGADAVNGSGIVARPNGI